MLVATLRQRYDASGSVTHDGYLLVAHLTTSGVAIRLYGRGKRDQDEQETPNQWLQLRMLGDALDYNGDASNSERYSRWFPQPPLLRATRSRTVLGRHRDRQLVKTVIQLMVFRPCL